MPSTGRTLSPPSGPLFLLDSSLSRNVGDSLRLVGYNFVTIEQAFDQRDAVKDPQIIQWAGDNGATWVHADDRARKAHRVQIIASRIRTLWVYRPKGIMNAAQQLRILAYVLPDLISRYDDPKCPLHFRVDDRGVPPKARIHLEEYTI